MKRKKKLAKGEKILQRQEGGGGDLSHLYFPSGFQTQLHKGLELCGDLGGY